MKKQVWEAINDFLKWKEKNPSALNQRTIKHSIAGWMYGNKIAPYMLLVHDELEDDGIGFNVLKLDTNEDLPQSLIEVIKSKGNECLSAKNPYASLIEFLEIEIEVSEKTHEQLSLL